MKQEFNVVDGKVVVTLTGSIYVEGAAAMREKLLEYVNKGYNNFLINLSAVDYIDSSGLGVFVAVQKRALQQGGGVVITGLSGVVQELFELTRLTKVFEIK
jgi:anti-sigma B factor antagonist